MFKKDLLLFDLETTGLNPNKHEIIQIASLRLDGSTLDEKSSFCTYVQPLDIGSADQEAMVVHKIDYALLEKAPSIKNVLAHLESKFEPADVLLSSYNTPFDVSFLHSAYTKNGFEWKFDFHSIDVWGLAYLFWSRGDYAAIPKKRVGFGLSDMAEILGIETNGEYHDALTDCRVAAEVLRILLAKIEIKK